MKAIYKLHFDCGRQGTLRGVFIEEKEKVDKLVASRVSVYYGEVLGKHSEIYGPLDTCDFTFVTDDPEKVKFVEELDLETGYNPVQTYIEHEGNQGNPSIFDEEDTIPVPKETNASVAFDV